MASLRLFPIEEDPHFQDVTSVSPFKPIAYIESVFLGRTPDGKDINRIPTSFNEIPQALLESLLKKNGIYVMTKFSESKESKISLTSKIVFSEKCAKTMVFHMEALTEMLELNKKLVLNQMNRFGYKTDRIDHHTVLRYVELISRESEFNDEELALVHALFSDPRYLENKNDEKIKLSENLSKYYKNLKVIQKNPRKWMEGNLTLRQRTVAQKRATYHFLLIKQLNSKLDTSKPDASRRV